MLSRKPQLLISTKCTAVPHGSYCRTPRVLHPSEYKIVALRLSYINCLFILAFEIFSNTSFYFVLSSVCLRTGTMNRPLRLRNDAVDYSRIPTYTHCRGRFIVPAYHGIHGVDILCFICFVFHLCHSICALMIFFFRSVAATHVATTLN